MKYSLDRALGCRISDEWTFKGLKTVILENEFLQIMVLADKGADIYKIVNKKSDVDYLWKSPWGVRDTSKFVPTTGSPESMWLDSYEGGWQTVFPGGGYPSTYNGVDLGLHAEANLAPWDTEILEDSRDKVSVKFSIRTARTPFYFEKILSLSSDSNILDVQEFILNEGSESMHCVWGEHIAIGEPFLDSDCIIDLPGGLIITHPESFPPNNRLAAGFEGDWPVSKGINGEDVDLRYLPDKSVKAMDMAYFTNLEDGWYSVTNRRIGVGIGVVFPKDVFPFLWYWQSFAPDGYPWYGRTYNVGLEPFTSYTNQGLAQAVENGTSLLISPGQKISASLKIISFESKNGIENIDHEGNLIFRKS